MSEAPEAELPARPAWQPFTFGGVAAFAEAGWLRLLAVELVAASFIAICVFLFARHAYAPVIVEAIQKMPQTARIAQGRLTGIDSTLLSESRFLGLAVTPQSAERIGQAADLQVQLRQTDFRVGAVFRPDWGWEFDYGPTSDLDLSASRLEPWWGAWHPVIFAVLGVGTMLTLFVLWALVGVIYTVPAQLVAWAADRQISWGGAARLGSAALLAPGLLVGVGIILYGWEGMDLVGLLFVWLAHSMISLVYLTGAVLACPKLFSGVVKQNPFKS